jgi:hypothetical protein
MLKLLDGAPRRLYTANKIIFVLSKPSGRVIIRFLSEANTDWKSADSTLLNSFLSNALCPACKKIKK